jgi:hypothetical protein
MHEKQLKEAKGITEKRCEKQLREMQKSIERGVRSDSKMCNYK